MNEQNKEKLIAHLEKGTECTMLGRNRWKLA